MLSYISLSSWPPSPCLSTPIPRTYQSISFSQMLIGCACTAPASTDHTGAHHREVPPAEEIRHSQYPRSSVASGQSPSSPSQKNRIPDAPTSQHPQRLGPWICSCAPVCPERGGVTMRTKPFRQTCGTGVEEAYPHYLS